MGSPPEGPGEGKDQKKPFNLSEKALEAAKDLIRQTPALLDKLEDQTLDGMSKDQFVDTLARLKQTNVLDGISQKNFSLKPNPSRLKILKKFKKPKGIMPI